MGRYIYFWGCQIPAHLPFVEKSIRLVMERTGKSADDIPGFTCCPETALVRSMGEELWTLTAARNLANAERYAKDPVLITPCNGCSSTLKTVWAELDANPQKKAEINQRLAEIDLHYAGNVRVKHLIEFFHQDVGLSKIKDYTVKPLVGMRVAIHTGCHFSRPNTPAMSDNALHPRALEELVEALSAEIVPYRTSELCCGQELARVDAVEDSLQMMRTKLIDVRSEEVDAIVVGCPACFTQFDHRQYLLQRQGEEFKIPVFYFAELMALSFGFSPEELFLNGHRISIEPFLKKWEANLEEYEKATEIVDIKLLRECYECGACVNDCPTALTDERFDPQRIMGLLLRGKLEETLEDGGFWLCVQCHFCSEICPQNIGMERFFEALRQEALRRGQIPKILKMGADLFEKKGMLAEIKPNIRKKYGLPDMPASGEEDLLKLLKKKK